MGVSKLSTETEIKIGIGDPDGFQRQLEGLQPRVVTPRHFEDNYLLDFPDRRLGSRQCLFRIRCAGERSFLTYKGPPRPEGIFKTREEMEIALESGTTALQIFKQLGMQVWFRYQKYRKEFAIPLSRRSGEEIHVAVDETPVGNYVEFEGSEEGIRELAHSMRIQESQFLRHSYYAIYLQYCQERGEIPGYMVFPAEREEKGC